jgi:cytochrome P450
MGIDALQVGIDTTGCTAAFLLYNLAANPDKQELLYQEICDTIGPGGAVTETALVKMKYMKACQTESQRILPAIFGTAGEQRKAL